MGKLDDYLRYYDKYSSLYGDRVAVFYQIGKFHEIYGVDNEQEKLGNVEEISNLLNIKLTRCKTHILENDRSNPLMAGFNSVSIDYNVDRLVEFGYTVVVVNQITTTDPPERDVVFIKSPSTNISLDSHRDPYLASIYVNKFYNRSVGKYYEYFGMSAIDITTGQTYWYETNSTPSDPELAFDDLTRFFQSFNPVEIIVTQNPDSDTIISRDHVNNWGFKISNEGDSDSGFDFSKVVNNIKPTVHLNYKGFEESGISFKKLESLSFQEQYLETYFGSKNTIINMGLQRAPMATVSIVYLLKFCSDHNKSLIYNIPSPIPWSDDDSLHLETSSIYQLNIIESYYEQVKQNSVLSLLSKSLKTSMGKRLLKNRILNGKTDSDILRARYDYIDEAKHLPIDEIRSNLGRLCDMDRLHRKITLLNLKPSELYILDNCYEIIDNIYTKFLISNEKFRNLLIKPTEFLKSYRQIYQKSIEMKLAIHCKHSKSFDVCFFKKGYSDQIDNLIEIIEEYDFFKDNITKEITRKTKAASCCYKENEDSCYIYMTKAQYNKSKNCLNDDIKFTINLKPYNIRSEDIHVDTRNKSNVKIYVGLLSEMYESVKETKEKLKNMTSTFYNELLIKLSKYQKKFCDLNNCIANLDLYTGMFYHANKYNYTRPNIIDNKKGESWVKVNELRHPIVERKVHYIPQSFSLGCPESNEDGMLLYGVNQSGKSCTMKALGISIVMAQAGIFVPATEFVFYPFKTLMTRILGNDNLDKGLSAYAVEMVELRSILQRANKNCIILGDEICHGTESSSAVSLVSASIIHLLKNSSKFIFATHLHELSQMEEITNLDKIGLYHLTIDCDKDKIIYDRNLKPGSGQLLYGLEVAKHLRLPQEVLSVAYNIRDKYYSNDLASSTAKKSKYNSDKIIAKCQISKCFNSADHTHHIRYQSEANEKGMVTVSMNKNHKDNLVGLCEKHHKEVHRGNDQGKQLIIFGYSGKELRWEYRKIISSLIS
jgi:DNA mismatch repair protein MutS